ncbi:MAG TPA: lysophospholipid acyltransferase family protein [Mycobacteriales bacterium]|nr:lysophospholipid acyltransferase family protein [Mycobacteriales bacterium]
MRPHRLGPWYRFAVLVLKPLLLLLTRRDWRNASAVPSSGGVIIAANHISHADPLMLCDFLLYGAKRIPRFLAKDTLFKGRGLVGRVMRGARQIPVYRQTADASLALRDAVEALRRGDCVAIYPEGTVTRDPGKWPMAAKTGVARLALLSGAPVVPVAQWGAQEILDSYRSPGLHLLPRKTMRVVAGPPIDLSAYRDRDLTAEVLRGATATVMETLTRMVEELRGETAPSEVHDPRRLVQAEPHAARRTA